MKYLEIIKQLNEKKIKYLIVGGLDVNLHGYSRFTADIDVIIELEENNIQRLITLLLNLGYKTKLPVNPIDFSNQEIRAEWINNKNMRTFNFYKEDALISEFDIIIIGNNDFKEKYSRRIDYDVDGIKISVIKHIIHIATHQLD